MRKKVDAQIEEEFKKRRDRGDIMDEDEVVSWSVDGSTATVITKTASFSFELNEESSTTPVKKKD